MKKKIYITLAVVLLIAIATTWCWLERRKADFRRRALAYNLAEIPVMNEASIILDRNGIELSRIFLENRIRLASEPTGAIVDAVISAEDQRFWEHGGVDYLGSLRAFLENIKSRRVNQGASTITQQLARITFGLRQRTYDRKFLEMAVAERIETAFSKEEILRLYLDRIYFGDGCYGAEAAALGYFGKSCPDLNAPEAALLAALIRSPNRLNPRRNPADAIASRNQVLDRMLAEGKLSADSFASALQTPLTLVPRKRPGVSTHAAEMVRRQAVKTLGVERALRGGFTIRTTIDSTINRLAEQAVQKGIADTEPFLPVTAARLQGSALVIENTTGGIVAIVGGRDFQESEFNRVIQARRKVGTAFAPITFAAFLEAGGSPAAVLSDTPLDNRRVMVGGRDGILGEWGVESTDNKYEGAILAFAAVAKGKNSAVVRMAYEFPLQQLQHTAAKLGFGNVRPFHSTALGESEVSLAEAVLGYSSFACNGVRPKELFIINSIEDRDGTNLFRHKPSLVRAISAGTAFCVHFTNQCSLQFGVGSRQKTPRLNIAHFAGHPGTSYGFTDLTMLGYSNAITCGVWLGYDQPAPLFAGAFSSKYCLPIWEEIVLSTQSSFPPTPIAPVAGQGRSALICARSGSTYGIECAASHSPVLSLYFPLGTSPEPICATHNPEHRSMLKLYDPSPWPRAVSTSDLSNIPAVPMHGSTVIGVDPYRSLTPTVSPPPVTVSMPGATPTKGPDEKGTETNMHDEGLLPAFTEEPVLPSAPPGGTGNGF